MVQTLSNLKGLIKDIVTTRESLLVENTKSYFDVSINRSRMSSTPPRAMEKIERAAAYTFFQKQIEDLIYLAQLRNCSTVEQTRSFFLHFSERRPDVTLRSRAITLVWCKDHFLGRFTPTVFIGESLKYFGVPCSYVEHEYGLKLIERLIKVRPGIYV